jgi:dihydroflavonol-4-reductase
VNVEGTRHVLAAARAAGVERTVVTSSVSAVGSAPRGGLADESAIWDLGELGMPYASSKFLGEVEALRAAATGQDVVVVNPSAPIGEWDWKPTPTGDVIVRFLRGRLPAIPNVLNNFVDVEDVARGHLLAAEQGRKGERYILSGANMDSSALMSILERASGRRGSPLRIPHGVAVAASAVTEVAFGAIRQTAPLTSGSAAFLKRRMYFDCAKATRELGYRPGPVEEAFGRAVAWYRSRGYAR